MVKLWQKERSKPNADLTIKAHMEKKTEAFKRVASEEKTGSWKASVTLSAET